MPIQGTVTVLELGILPDIRRGSACGSLAEHPIQIYAVVFHLRLAAKEAECRELHKELHDLRSHAQILQNKLALAELVLGRVEAAETLPHRQNPKSGQP